MGPIVARAAVGNLQVAELLCDTLKEAEDTPSLQFVISSDEVSHGTALHFILSFL